MAPQGDGTFADLAAQLAASYGLAADPWQRLVLDDWLATTDGLWSSLTCGLSVPRQNGKNALIEIRELFGTVGQGEKFLHTAHEVKTARKHFKRLQYFFGEKRDDPAARFPELNKLVQDVRNTNGQEAVYLYNGGSIEIVARSKGSARGYTVDTLVMDEAQDASDEDVEALLPTTSAAPSGNPQWIYAGTPPGPKVNGEVFTRIRSSAIDGDAELTSWHEWSFEDGAEPDDERQLALANPGLINGRLQMSVIHGERGALSDEGYCRERGGQWSTRAGNRVIPQQFWDSAGDDLSIAVDRFALGVEVGPDMRSASVSLAGQREDGSWHVELDEQKEGTAWLVPYVAALLAANPQVRCVAADAGSPTAALFDDFAKAKVKLTAPKVTDLGTGCSRFLEGIVSCTLRHNRQSQMSVAASVAGKRKLGDTGMWVWSRATATSDITPIQSATLALWGAQAMTVKRPFGRTKRKVVVPS